MVLDAAGIEGATRRIAHEILERESAQDLALVAIAAGGVPVAERLAAHLRDLCRRDVPHGVLDVTLYRDDVIAYGRRPTPQRTRLDFPVGGKRVVLIEDVVFTGRTVRAAMDAIIDFGRPDAIEVATLVDRGHRELPIRVDYVGKNIPTSRAERVVLRRNDAGDLEVIVE